VIGRAAHCDLVLPSNPVSRRYAKVERDGADFFIEDLGSASGIFSRKQKIGRHRVEDGDVYFLGTVPVRAMLREDELETPLIRAAADQAAVNPTDRARRELWSDLLLERADPLGAWLVATQAFPQVTTGPGAAMSWEDRLIRTAEVRRASACHLVELNVWHSSTGWSRPRSRRSRPFACEAWSCHRRSRWRRVW